MSLTQVTGPYPIFTDLDGSPLDDGYLYIGDQNDDPETNPIQVFWDSALTIPATQPIRTNSGYAWRNGTPGLLYTAGPFSITIRNKRNEFVLYSPVGYGFDPAAVSASVTKNDFVGNGVEVDFTLSAAPSTILATNVFINGVYQEKDSYSITGNVITFSVAPPLGSSVEIMTNETGVINSGNATAISYTAGFAGATAQTVQEKLEQSVSVKDFGAVGDGVADDTAAFQDALDSLQPIYIPPGTYLITDTLKLYEGSVLYGNKTVSPDYAKANTRIAFTPATARDAFNWAVAPTGYTFGVYLGGFTIRGFGGLIDTVIELPFAYGMVLDNLNAYAGFAVGAKPDQWLQCVVNHCHFAGFSSYAVAIVKTAGQNTTNTAFRDCYMAQGPIGVYALESSVWGIVFDNCVIESVDTAIWQNTGNYMWFNNLYMENVPRTNTLGHQAIRIGLEGAAVGTPQGAIYLNGGTYLGWQGGSATNTLFINAGWCRNISISNGFGTDFGAFINTSATTSNVFISGVDWDNTANFSFANGIADQAVFTLSGFRPRGMFGFNGAAWVGPPQAIFPTVEITAQPRTNIIERKLFVDATWDRKLRYRDSFGNFSNPIGALRTGVTTGWTFQGGMLASGEIVVASNIETGAPALWYSTLHSRDTAATVTGGTSTSGSPTVTNATGAYNGFIVGDWVTATAGFPSTSTQYQILAIASNGSSVTLDTNSNASVSGTVTLATAAHNLQPISQQGHRTYGANPVGVIVPKYVGEELLRTDTVQWYKSSGLTSADWKAMT